MHDDEAGFRSRAGGKGIGDRELGGGGKRFEAVGGGQGGADEGLVVEWDVEDGAAAGNEEPSGWELGLGLECVGNCSWRKESGEVTYLCRLLTKKSGFVLPRSSLIWPAPCAPSTILRTPNSLQLLTNLSHGTLNPGILQMVSKTANLTLLFPSPSLLTLVTASSNTRTTS